MATVACECGGKVLTMGWAEDTPEGKGQVMLGRGVEGKPPQAASLGLEQGHWIAALRHYKKHSNEFMED